MLHYHIKNLKNTGMIKTRTLGRSNGKELNVRTTFTTGSLLIHSYCIHYTISAWSADEPSSKNGTVGEDCVVIDKYWTFLWNDVSCAWTKYPVCEKAVSEKVFHF